MGYTRSDFPNVIYPTGKISKHFILQDRSLCTAYYVGVPIVAFDRDTFESVYVYEKDHLFGQSEMEFLEQVFAFYDMVEFSKEDLFKIRERLTGVKNA